MDVSLERKNEILRQTLERVKRENDILKMKCDSSDKVKKTMDELQRLQEEFSFLNAELRKEIKEYKELNHDCLILRAKLRNTYQELTK